MNTKRESWCRAEYSEERSAVPNASKAEKRALDGSRWNLVALGLTLLILSVLALAGCAASRLDRTMTAEDEIRMTHDSIAGMTIVPGMKISLYRLREQFPFRTVTHEIRQADSPDFHSFTVSTHEGNALFEFVAFIEAPEEYEQAVVLLDELVVYSSSVTDQFGVSPGMRVSDAVELRQDLEFGHGHVDYFVGGGSIWYAYDHFFDPDQPNDVVVGAITWPHPVWR